MRQGAANSRWHLSRRRRRTFLTAIVCLALLAAIAAAALHRRDPEHYNPSAPIEGITATLERRAWRHSTH